MTINLRNPKVEAFVTVIGRALLWPFRMVGCAIARTGRAVVGVLTDVFEAIGDIVKGLAP